MENNGDNKKRAVISSTPAWHIGAQAFIALLIILIVPLVVNVRSAITALMSNTDGRDKVPKAVVVEQKNKTTLTRFLAAAVFGVNPDTNVVQNPVTGKEEIILPYGGNANAGGNLPGSGDVNTDRWMGAPPASDGSVPVIYKYQYTLPNSTSAPISTGGNIGGTGNTNAGGTIKAGGTIPAGGTI